MDDTIIFDSENSFTVPNRLVDKYLSAPETELRLILFLLRNQNLAYKKEEITEKLACDEAALDRAFEYWCKAGLLYKSGNRYSIDRPKIAATEVMRYSSDQVAARINQDNGIQFLFNTAETLLKRPLSTNDSSVILGLSDWNGLPPQVACLLVQYVIGNGYGLSRVQKMGIEWAEKEINTDEKAEEYIKAEMEKREMMNIVSKALGISHRALTEAEKRVFTSWTTELGFNIDMIKLAYEQTVKNTGKYSYQYMDKILADWHKNGYKNAEEVALGDSGTTKKAKKSKGVLPKNTAAKKKQTGDWDIIKKQLGDED